MLHSRVYDVLIHIQIDWQFGFHTQQMQSQATGDVSAHFSYAVNPHPFAGKVMNFIEAK